MIFGGFQRTDMVDYPGHVASIAFTTGCNFRCPYCHNPSLVELMAEAIPDTDILDFLKSRRAMLDGLVISGGEPCLHAHALPAFIEQVKALGLSVKLDTNGSFPTVLQNFLDAKLLDYVAMDIKTGREHYLKVTKGDYHLVDKSLAILKESGVEYELRTTCVPGLVTEEDIDDIADWIKGSKRWVLQHFNPKVTLDSECSKIVAYPDQWYTDMVAKHKDAATSVSIR